MHPFDIRSALLAKHAQHVVLIHFPIALYLTGVACDAAGEFLRTERLKEAAAVNFLLAAVSAIPAVLTGLAAWQWALEGKRLRGVLLEHLLFGCAALALLWLTVVVNRMLRNTNETRLGRWRFAVQAAGSAAIAIAGHLGGFLSGVNVG